MRKPIGVHVLSEYIKKELITNPILKNLYVVGEVTNLRDNKYLYFDLKEGNELINCVCFNNDYHLENGDEVIVTGSINLYTRSSRYQINVVKIEQVGQGDSSIQLEKLKKKLYSLGYFDEFRKKAIPKLPVNIGLITSDKSAAIVDFLSILEENYPIADVFLYSTRVQGKLAINEIVSSIKLLDNKKLDLIVITRGGGSSEDLALFNDESIATAIFEAQTPIISAVGHEIDITICDLVSDLRVSTPTKAAEYIIRNMNSCLLSIESYKNYNDKFIKDYLEKIDYKLNFLNSQIDRYSPINLLKEKIFQISTLNKDNDFVLNDIINKKRSELSTIYNDIEDRLKMIMKKNMVEIKALDGQLVDITKLKINSEYIAENELVKYRIEVLEKVDGR